MPIKTGDTARLIQPEIKGAVLKRRISPADQTEVLLEYQDSDGTTQRRWFLEGELQLVEAAQ